MTNIKVSGINTSQLFLTPASFAPAVSYSVGSEPYSIIASDFNGDNIADLVNTSAFANTVVAIGLSYAYMQGLMSFSVSNFADFITSTQEAAKIVLVTALAHNVARSCANSFLEFMKYDPHEEDLDQYYYEVSAPEVAIIGEQ